MKLFSLILGLFILSGQLAYGARHCKTERKRTYAEQLASLSPGFELDFIDFEIFPDSSIAIGYEYEVEPAHTQGLYSRTDSWLISTKYIPKKDFELSEGIDANLSIGPKQKNIATFIRFFSDPCEAMQARPYSPRRIPLRTRVALGKKFKKGDYFLFRGSVGLVATGELLALLGNTPWGLSFSASYLMEGFYQLHIVRLDDTHVRLKVVAHRARNFSGNVGLGYDTEFNIFKVGFLDNGLEKLVNTKPIKVQVDRNKNNVFLLDYVLDLSDPEVTSAFEKILRKVSDYKYLNLLKPFDLESSLLLDLSALEDLYRRDLEEDKIGRLKRNLRTSSNQKTLGFSLNVGNKVLGFKLGSDRSTALMSINHPDDSVERFLLKTWGKKWDGRFFYSLSKSKKEEGLQALFLADEGYQKLEPLNIVKYIKHKKNRFSFRDYNKLKMMLKKALPVQIYQEIPWENWTQTKKQKFINYGLRFELILSPEALFRAPELTKEEIKVFFRDHIKSKGLTAKNFFFSSNDGSGRTLTPEDKFESNLRQMAFLLEKVLDKERPILERTRIITRLRRNLLFSEAGLSFLMGLNPDKMKDWYNLDLDISANESLIDFSYGDSNLSLLYKKILTIKAALDDDGLDLLREAESISVPEAG